MYDEDRTQEVNVHDEHDSTSAYEGDASYAHTSEVIRPTGISWVTVAFGLICLVMSGLVLTLQLSELRVDWDVAVPGFVISAGAALMVAGALALLKGRTNDEAL